jgi:hypothetical protein
VSAVVDVDRLLDEDGSLGAENVLDTVDTSESWEFGRSGLGTVAIAEMSKALALMLAWALSVGAIDK